MKRVLQVTSKLFRGGAEAFIMNVYRNIDREKVQFDFLVFRSPREYYEDEIENLGGNIFHVPVMEGANLIRRKAMLDEFFNEHHDYIAVHGHMAALGRDYLRSAAEHGIDQRFAHSHIADFERTPRNYVKQAFQRRFGEYATRRFACSRAAGEFMYPGQSFEVINNGIDTYKFRFDASRRVEYREHLGFTSQDHVVGHVGRFEMMKNHTYLIEVFAALAEKDPDAKLLLAGDGSLRSQIEEKVHRLGIQDRVTFLGVIDDMPSFYDGIDCFVMPSLFEGLPFSAIEAQCSGVPCLLSTTITSECSVTDLVKYQDLQASVDDWADDIQGLLLRQRDRGSYSGLVRNAGFDIQDIAAYLCELYLGQNE